MSRTRWIAFCLAAAVVAPVSSADSPSTSVLSLLISGVTPGQGQLMVAVCDEKTFMNATCFRESIVKVESAPQRVVFVDIPDGRWAVAVVYDLNTNQRLDTNFLGIPREPVGASRNAVGFMGPPKFKDAAFELKGEPASLEIQVK